MKKAMIALSVLVFSGFNIYCQTPEEIVNDTVKKLNSSKFSSDMNKSAEIDPKFYTLKESVRVDINELQETNAPDYSKIFVDPKKGLVDDTLVAVEKIVNIADKVWQMVKDNKPVVNIDSRYAVALPKGVTAASDLSNWSKPKSYLISFYFENLYGMDVVNVSYKVTYVYGGSYNGTGKYLAAVWAIPVSVDVMWGFSFTMSALVPDATVVNIGTDSKPVAALQLKVSWAASSALKEMDGTAVYYIQGDGYFEELASPFRSRKTNISSLNNISLD
ncbi:MAG: hypothetical protein GX445_01330 [Elusimicrobia bacterium]|jgi:hypothetical protein|nr:hypothetical protein [Elusimicrobiota bacterium]